LSSEDSIDLGAATVDPGQSRIEGAGGELALQPRLLDVLVELDRNRGEVVSREALIERVWDSYPGADQSLTNCISKLRMAIQSVGGDPAILRTVPKRGYCLDPTGKELIVSKADNRSSVPALIAVGALVVIAVVVAAVLVRDGAGDVPRLGVLPMATVGDSADNELARGIGQEISTRLAELDDVELVYGGTAALAVDGLDTLRLTGDALAVDYLLTGSFRRETDDAADSQGYRVAVQLIRVADGTSLWGEIFRAPAGKLFDLEVEIATAVAAAIPGVRTPIIADSTMPTGNALAYRSFVRAIGLSRRALPTAEQVADAYFGLRRAVDLDPGFARAWAELSNVLGLQERWDLIEPDIDAATALARATELAPNDPDVLIAKAIFLVRNGETPETANEAIAALLGALERRPNSARALSTLALALRQAGAFSLSVDAAEASVRRAPHDPFAIGTASMVHAGMRSWRRTESLSERMIELEPASYLPWQARAESRFYATGSVAEAREILAGAPRGLVPAKVHAQFDFYADDPAAVIARAEPLIDRDGTAVFVATHPVLATYAGFAYRLAGNDAAADSIAAAAVRLWQGFLDTHADDPMLLSGLSRVLLLAGRIDDAFAAACRVVRLRAGNLSDYLGHLENLAHLAAMTGRNAEALELIELLLASDYGRTPMNRHALRAEPMWDGLRDVEAFRRLLERAPVSSEWSDQPIRTARLLERVRAVEPPPTPVPAALGTLCAD
jgi:DNA-binding winged helix-turn-helix (wHTH) protein/TolB-like protein/tetratricopeptide (TPR) repeat protein